jgi:hypothetical protein
MLPVEISQSQFILVQWQQSSIPNEHKQTSGLWPRQLIPILGYFVIAAVSLVLAQCHAPVKEPLESLSDEHVRASPQQSRIIPLWNRQTDK